MNTETKQFDIVISGGGLTGLILAIALARLNLKVALIDTKPLTSTQLTSNAPHDVRALALSYHSQLILSEFKFWDHLQQNTIAIKKIHVSDRGHLGFTRINASDYHVPCLGSIISIQALQHFLITEAQSESNISWFCPAEVLETQSDIHERTIKIKVEDHEIILSCKLLVTAEGSSSSLTKMLNLLAKKYDYQQIAVVSNVEVNQSHDFTAYERFTASGPLALLPISSNKFSLVWTLKPNDAAVISQLDEKNFLMHLQQAFGYRLGKFTRSGPRQTFPLYLSKLNSVIAPRAVIIGNAAHTLHPIAGQGFNLGLRDIATLVQHITLQQQQNNEDFGKRQILNNYEKERINDYNKIVNITDRLVTIFSNRFVPLALMRNLALVVIDNSAIKHSIAKTLMGFS